MLINLFFSFLPRTFLTGTSSLCATQDLPTQESFLVSPPLSPHKFRWWPLRSIIIISSSTIPVAELLSLRKLPLFCFTLKANTDSLTGVTHWGVTTSHNEVIGVLPHKCSKGSYRKKIAFLSDCRAVETWGWDIPQMGSTTLCPSPASLL